MVTKIFIFIKWYSLQIGFINVKNNDISRVKSQLGITEGGVVSRGNQLEYRIVLSDKFSIVSSFLFRYQLSIDWYLMYINRNSLISLQKYNEMYLFLYFWIRNWFLYKYNKKNMKKITYIFIKFDCFYKVN